MKQLNNTIHEKHIENKETAREMQKKKLFSFHFRVHSNNKAKVKKTLTFQKPIKKYVIS